jgi:prepilin peptidase CpaA
MIAPYVSFAIAAILLAAILLETKTGKIPNWLTLLPFVVFIAVLALTEDRSALYGQMGLAAAVFGFGLLLFAFAGFGAGAVKLMTGLALFIPLSEGLWTLGVFIVALFASAFIIVQLRKFVGSEQSSWYLMAKPVLPMSVPIGIAGLASLFVI